jgi:polyphosphate kinase
MKNKQEQQKITTRFLNRELSWLEFNQRVLEESQCKNTPLFERLRFISIVSSNLDEFFMVRVGFLWEQVQAGFNKIELSGLNLEQQLSMISSRAHKMISEQSSCYNYSLIDALKKENIVFLRESELTDLQKEFIERYYNDTIYPVLTPMVVDKSRPFPLILNKSLNIALLLKVEDEKESLFAIVQVPSVLGRYLELPSYGCKRCFILMEDIIKIYLNEIFRGHSILCKGYFRVTRNADLGLHEEDTEDLLEIIEESLKQRKWGSAIRLEIEKGMSNKLVSILKKELEIRDAEIYDIVGPLDLTFLMKFSDLSECENLRYKAFKPRVPSDFELSSDIFEVIAKHDIIIHNPFESFEPVIRMVQQAAEDDNVLAIKQTLYRVSGNSPIIEALEYAAEKGKQVTVLVEIKARFDEENNIHWAKRLEKAGCHVIYGLMGLKTHCKILLVVRKEQNGIKRYVHMATGNYNDITANLYTDIGLFTANTYFGADASALFNMISGYSKLNQLYKLDVAPLTLRHKFMSLINREIQNAKLGKKASIIAKFNSLVDKEIIEAFYEASNAGVEIDLIVRGICCLKPGVKGLSEKIRVRSIVGRFLEHSRIYYFYNAGEECIYLSSSDLMDRNLDRRIELLFPIEDTNNKKILKDILEVYLKDVVKARILNMDGTYKNINKKGKKNINSQEYLFEVVKKNKE